MFGNPFHFRAKTYASSIGCQLSRHFRKDREIVKNELGEIKIRSKIGIVTEGRRFRPA
jgi:hypothetical protein